MCNMLTVFNMCQTSIFVNARNSGNKVTNEQTIDLFYVTYDSIIF